MKWIRSAGLGHVVEAECGRITAPPDEEVEATNLYDRPYGPDSCQTCHGRVKRWAAGLEPAPEGLFPEGEPEPPRVRLSAAERAAAIQGQEAAPLPANNGDTAPEPIRGRKGKESTVLEPGSDADMGWPDDEGGEALATSGGAVVVPIKPRSRSRRKSGADDGIDSD
jgi:hypothetical protein